MNRAQRRRLQIEDKDPVLNVRESELKEQLQNLKKASIKDSAQITSALFALVLNSEYGFGKRRINRALERVSNQIECVLSGHLSGGDIVRWCKEKKLDCFEMES